MIVQLRNPAARIWSHFNYISQQADIPIDISFEEYVDVLLGGKANHNVFTREPWSQHLLENQLASSNYYTYLSRWCDRFPRDNTKILILEDLYRDKLHLLQGVADWIGVSSAYYDHRAFKTANATRSRASSSIRRFLRGCATYFPQFITSAAKQIIDSTLVPFKMKKTSSDLSAISTLEDYFEGPNQCLQREFDLDLASWCR